MSRRTYIASHSKQNEQERAAIFDTVLLPDMLKREDNRDYFSNHLFLEHFGCVTELELNKEPTINRIIPRCLSYLPESIIQKYHDYVPTGPQDENFIGLLTRELLWQYLQELQIANRDRINERYLRCKEDPQYAAEYAVSMLAEQLVTHETSLKMAQPKQIPYFVASSYEYFLYQVYDLYARTDFDRTDLLVYSW